MARPLRLAPLILTFVAITWLAACDAEPAAHGDASDPAPIGAVSTDPGSSTSTIAMTSTTARSSTTATSTIATNPTATSTTATTGTTTSTTVVQPAPTTTSCTTVAHIGDSTSVSLFDPAYVRDAADLLPAQYERVGVLALYTEVSGGRSTVETRGGHENAFDTVLRLREMGYQGCWVVTIGTNDAANVSIGGVPDLGARLDRMMVLFGEDPVLWIDAVTHLDDGPYADVNMQTWNDVLGEAELRFPTLRVFRWSDVVVDEWFVADGIHYTSNGSAWRSHVIADALVAAFPAGRP